MTIKALLQQKNYAVELWAQRGLEPSSDEIVKELESTTTDFLLKLDAIHHNVSINKEIQLKQTNDLVDDLPWCNFDTEEKEFLADVIAPAIESMGFDPWEII